jgi:signal transduction histidine kinase
VKLTVADTGTGIGPDILERIFDPYFTTWSLEGCSGLGLSVALGIVQKSGGTIEVSSRPGAGAAFHVYLPRAEAGRPEPPMAPTGPFPRGR